MHQVQSESLKAVLDKYPSFFQDGLGTMRGFEVKVYVGPEAKAKFWRARTDPYTLKDKVYADYRMRDN